MFKYPKRLNDRQDQQLKVFKEELLKTNQVMNLFSRKNPNFQLNILFSSSLASANILSEELKATQGPVLDIGSGNGFPGLVFALLFPKLKFHLCERNRKKAEFLKFVSSKAQISNTQVLCLPAEDLKTGYQTILSQAALPLEKTIPLLNKLLLPSGKAFLWQGRRETEEGMRKETRRTAEKGEGEGEGKGKTKGDAEEERKEKGKVKRPVPQAIIDGDSKTKTQKYPIKQGIEIKSKKDKTRQKVKQEIRQEIRQGPRQRLKQKIRQEIRQENQQALGRQAKPSSMPLSIQPFKTYKVMGSEKLILKLSKAPLMKR